MKNECQKRKLVGENWAFIVEMSPGPFHFQPWKYIIKMYCSCASSTRTTLIFFSSPLLCSSGFIVCKRGRKRKKNFLQNWTSSHPTRISKKDNFLTTMLMRFKDFSFIQNGNVLHDLIWIERKIDQVFLNFALEVKLANAKISYLSDLKKISQWNPWIFVKTNICPAAFVQAKVGHIPECCLAYHW